MTHATEIESFQTNIRSVAEIMAFVDRVAEDAELQESTAGTRFGDPMSAACRWWPWRRCGNC